DLSGRVRDRVQSVEGRLRVTLDVDATTRDGQSRRAEGRVLVTIAHPMLPWQIGDRAHATLQLRRPRNFGNPGEFDYAVFLARRQIYVAAFAMSDARWRRDARGVDLDTVVDVWRAAIRTALTGTLDGIARDIMAALIIGDGAALPAAVWDRYARTGV